MAVVRWKIGLKSGFDTDSDGNPINSVIDSSVVFNFTYNPETQVIGFTNMGEEVTLINGVTRIVKGATSTHKKIINITQKVLTNDDYESFVSLIVDADEDLVLVDDDSDVYVVHLNSFNVARRRSTADRLVSWVYSMGFLEVS